MIQHIIQGRIGEGGPPVHWLATLHGSLLRAYALKGVYPAEEAEEIDEE
jgi:hypothetical protein